ncbi:hypothetical protein KPH14_004006 [Odynerus spinipes]|uniref:Uncharacterized protein n=1 Tax=Odynerus spinipes TaxID=1348599 RepID=A0AAD9VUY3_9HYME|nr:hypothetical protein KPH14_004006 [Odynerus spinipes]
MAKRRSSNKRSSRYNRSSVGSVALNPNSEVYSEGEPFWWNNLTSNANPNLVKYNAMNETSKYLDSGSQTEFSNSTNTWWKELDSSDSDVSNNLPKTQSNEQPDATAKTTKTTISDSDKESSPRSTQKRKIKIRGKSKRSKSNAFLKAIDDSENSESSKLIQESSIAKSINNNTANTKSLEKSDFTEKRMSNKDNNVTTSTDQSHTTDKIMKLKPTVFRKRYKEKKENAFENLIKSVEDRHDETEKSGMISTNSVDKLIERSSLSEGNVLNESKERTLQMHSSTKNSFKQPIVNAKISKYDGSYMYHNRSDSTFETESDYISEPLQKESFATDKHTDPIIDSTASKTINSSYVNNKKTKSPKTYNKNKTPLKHMKHTDTLNESNISERSTHSKINSSNRSINVMQQKRITEEDTIKEINDDNPTSQTLLVNEISKVLMNLSHSKHKTANLESDSTKHSVNLSHSKRRKTNPESDDIIITTSFKHNNNTISDSIHDVTKSFANDNLGNVSKMNVSKKQISTVSSHSNTIFSENAIEDMNENEKFREPMSASLLKRTSVHNISNLNKGSFSKDIDETQSKELDISASTSKHKSKTSLFNKENDHIISNLNEESFSKDIDETQPKELDINASTSNYKTKRTTDIVANHDDQNVHDTDQLRHKTVNSVNTGQQRKINEYFTFTSPTLASLTKAKLSQNNQVIKKTKKDEEIKARLEKEKDTVDKGINVYLNKIQESTRLKGKEIIEKIKKHQTEETKKQPKKSKFNKAYLINGKIYKRPKLPRPQPWVTDRFYRHLWKVMAPKCKLLTRVESEKFVKKLSTVVSTIIKSKKYENYKTQLDDLMIQMAHLGIIYTRNDFYDFCYEFLPYDFRVKVVPMINPGNVKNIPYDPEDLHKPLLKE